MPGAALGDGARQATGRWRALITSTLLALATAALYLPRLQGVPPFLSRDELFSALAAQSVASTGHDPDGIFMPVFFQMHLLNRMPPMWFQPVLIYGITLVLKVLPLSESAIRLPMAMACVADVVLMYFVARLLFEREVVAVGAAGLLALTPVHVIFGRVAMDYQMPLPFVLAWLLSLLVYLKTGKGRALFGAGAMLGIGLYTYIAAYMLMPIYLFLTGVVLYQRHERLNRYSMLAIGFLLPLVLCVPFLVQHPTVIRNVALYYHGNVAQSRPTLELIGAWFGPRRIGRAFVPYALFWNPRFLFINGPAWIAPSMWQTGVFLLPLGGLLVAGAAAALRQLDDPRAALLIGGLLTAPLPSSLISGPENIARSLAVVPFVVLLAIWGLHRLWKAPTDAVGSTAFFAIWVIAVALAVASHDHVPRAQAYVRAATVPLAVVALAMFFGKRLIDDSALRSAATVAVVLLLAIQVAYVLGAGMFVTIAALGLLLWGAVAAAPMARRNGFAAPIVVLLSLLSSSLLYSYVDYPAHRVGAIPASALVIGLRLVSSTLLLVACIAVVRATHRRTIRRQTTVSAAIALAIVAWIEVAYFYIDWVTDPVARFIQVASILLPAVWLGTCLANPERRRLILGPMTFVAAFVLAALQFSYFYSDYFRMFHVRGSSDVEGNVAIAIETAIDRTRGRLVPMIYIERARGELGGGDVSGLGKKYAGFYMIKHHRTDLIARTVEGEEFGAFEPDRISRLPPDSIVIANRSEQNDRFVAQMIAAGTIKNAALLRAPDGAPVFWILERTAD